MHFVWFQKANPYRDAGGRFASAENDSTGQAATVAPERADKIKTAPKAIARFTTDPDSFLRYPVKKMRDALVGGFPPDARLKSSVQDATTQDGNIGLLIDTEVHASGELIAQVARVFDPATSTVEHTYFAIRDGEQDGGLAARTLETSIRAYGEAGYTKVVLSSGLDRGGYAWAKYGWLPADVEQWTKVRSAVAARALLLDEPDRSEVGDLVSSDDARSLWDVADHPRGKALLSGTSWRGVLRLDNVEQMDRFNAKILEKKMSASVKKSDANRLVPVSEVLVQGEVATRDLPAATRKAYRASAAQRIQDPKLLDRIYGADSR